MRERKAEKSGGKRTLAALAAEIMRLPCNRPRADKLWIYESQRIYARYFRGVRR